MARLERALVAVSGTLGQLANNSMEREHERVMAMRQENFMRLQNMLGEQSREADRQLRREETQAEIGARKDLFQQETAARKEMLDTETRARQQEGAADRSSRERIAGMEITAQKQRYEREDLRSADAQYLTRTNAIDKRIQELNDYKVQAQAEGKLVDNSYLSQIDQELSQLGEQKRSLAQERDVMLARGGDSRYRKLSAEEVANLKKQGQGPGMGAGTEMPMAAQGPREPVGGGTSIKIPQAPPKPQGMTDREERKNRPPAQPWERPQSIGELEGATTNMAPPAPPAPPRRTGLPEAGEGARQLVSVAKALGRDVVNDFQDISPLVKDVKAALAAGKQPSQQQIQELSRVKPYMLRQEFTADQLKALGL